MDYQKLKLKLKSGLEIHQQLDTNNLFCNCPSLQRKDEPHFTIKRRLHAVAGEEGEIDEAVKHEASLDKEFVYQGYNDTTCFIELDEEPPKQINQQALEEAIKIALLMNCEIYPVSQIMRKTVIDGSNTSGFQRTVLIAHDGFIETSFGKVGIETLALEEDAARIIEKNKSTSIYRLDRLGIPLVEIMTSPSMSTPEQVKETALKLGEILRACKVKRGIGTIRQDVNISTSKHPRVEIKGFQEPRIMTKTIDLEIERQQSSKAPKAEVRNALPDGKTEFLRPMPGRARMYPETDLPLLRISRDLVNKIKKQLPKLKTEIQDELKRKGLSTELISLVTSSPDALDEFHTLSKLNKDANLIAKMTTLWQKPLKKKLTEAELEKILESLNKKEIEKSDIQQVMTSISKDIPFQEAVKIEKVSHDEIEEEIRKIIKEKPGLRPNAYMGLIMARFKGKLDAKKAMEIIDKVIEEK